LFSTGRSGVRSGCMEQGGPFALAADRPWAQLLLLGRAATRFQLFSLHERFVGGEMQRIRMT
jgi:hypothetical protein